jgi:hypothetical protein
MQVLSEYEQGKESALQKFYPSFTEKEAHGQ